MGSIVGGIVGGNIIGVDIAGTLTALVWVLLVSSQLCSVG